MDARVNRANIIEENKTNKIIRAELETFERKLKIMQEKNKLNQKVIKIYIDHDLTLKERIIQTELLI